MRTEMKADKSMKLHATFIRKIFIKLYHQRHEFFHKIPEILFQTNNKGFL